MKKITKAIFPVAGLGTRFLPATKAIPKEMLPIIDKPLIEYAVEEAVLAEFDRLTERGGVLGAMERMYQRNKIQEESLYYEHQKHTGELPIIGVNTFLNKKGSPTVIPGEVIRSNTEEKEQQINNLRAFQQRNATAAEQSLRRLQEVAISNGNLFEELMETVKTTSLGEITHALYQVGGQYRRNM